MAIIETPVPEDANANGNAALALLSMFEEILSVHTFCGHFLSVSY